ncbi:MAG: DUF2970 domain-containing protein [Pseudomonadota bacterium]
MSEVKAGSGTDAIKHADINARENTGRNRAERADGLAPAAKAGDASARAPSSKGRERLGPLQVVGSVLAAGLGVQSSRNRERDFQQGRAGVFIVAGFIFTALFIGAVYTVVSVVLASR